MMTAKLAEQGTPEAFHKSSNKFVKTASITFIGPLETNQKFTANKQSQSAKKHLAEHGDSCL